MDLYTIRKELGHLDNLRIVLVGDLLNGRTIHSLLTLLSQCPRISIALVSPPELRLPARYTAELAAQGIDFLETESLAPVMPDADVVYITRVQRERFASDQDYARVKDAYIIDSVTVETLKREAILMHALPAPLRSHLKSTPTPAPPTFARPRTASTSAWPCSITCSPSEALPPPPLPYTSLKFAG